MNTTAIASCIASAVIAAAGAWAYQGRRYDAQLYEVQLSYSKRDFKALEAQYAETVRYQRKADEAAKNAAARVRNLAADRDILRGAVERLRNDLTAMPECRSASTDDTPGADNSNTIKDILSECAIRYGEVAEHADRAVSEVILLRESWPR